LRFLETDTILRYLTRDDEAKAAEVLELLRRVDANKEQVTTSPLVIFEVVFTLQTYYKLSRTDIRDRVLTILYLKGLSLSDKGVFVDALDDFCELNLPFADAFNACYMKQRKIHEIYSYDEHYDKIVGIRRVLPQ
jgi:uncharacterized protein